MRADDPEAGPSAAETMLDEDGPPGGHQASIAETLTDDPPAPLDGAKTVPLEVVRATPPAPSPAALEPQPPAEPPPPVGELTLATVSPKVTFEFLARHSDLRSLSLPVLEALTAIAKEKSIEPGKAVYVEWDGPGPAYVLRRGSVRLTARARQLGASDGQLGQVFGLRSAVERKPRTETLHAPSGAALIELPTEPLRALVAAHPELADFVRDFGRNEGEVRLRSATLVARSAQLRAVRDEKRGRLLLGLGAAAAIALAAGLGWVYLT